MCSTHFVRRKLTTTSWNLNVASLLGLRPSLGVQCLLCGWSFVTGADQASIENTFSGWGVENWDKNSLMSLKGQKIFFERIWRKTTRRQHKQPLTPSSMNQDEFFSAVTYTMWPCPEQRGVIVGCLYLEIEGQSTDSTIPPPQTNGFLSRTFHHQHHGGSTRGKML